MLPRFLFSQRKLHEMPSGKWVEYNSLCFKKNNHYNFKPNFRSWSISIFDLWILIEISLTFLFF